MSTQKSKGLGATTNNSITLNLRVKLFDWCKTHKEDRRTFAELAMVATSELGFTVTTNCMQNHWTAVHGPRHIRQNGGTLSAKIIALETRLTDCERRLTTAGA